MGWDRTGLDVDPGFVIVEGSADTDAETVAVVPNGQCFLLQ